MHSTTLQWLLHDDVTKHHPVHGGGSVVLLADTPHLQEWLQFVDIPDKGGIFAGLEMSQAGFDLLA